jgi:GST-like protein
MIDVYYWPTANGRKVTIALEEAGLPYNIVPVNPWRGDAAKPEFRKINPNGKIPAIADNDPKGGGRAVIFESAAILQYIAEKSGKLMPADTVGRYDVIKWLTFQAASVGPIFGQFAHFHDYARESIQYALNRYGRELERLYGVLDTRLGEAPFLAGEFSVADIAHWPWIQPARQEQDLANWPNIKRWYEAIAARPAVIRGNAVRNDLQHVGVQKLTDEQWNFLYGWQQAPRAGRAG